MPSSSVRRERLLIEEMITAAEEAHSLVIGVSLDDLEADRQRRAALLWNFTVVGEAAAQLSQDAKDRFPDIPWTRMILRSTRRGPQAR